MLLLSQRPSIILDQLLLERLPESTGAQGRDLFTICSSEVLMDHIEALKTFKHATQLARGHEVCDVLPGNLGQKQSFLDVGGCDLRYLLVVLLHLLEGIQLLFFVCHELSSQDFEHFYLFLKYAVSNL